MVFEPHGYSVLVVSAAERFNDAMTRLLPEVDCSPVCFAENVAAARRTLLERSFDFVLINTPLPDDFGAKLAIDLCKSRGTVALLLVRAELHEEQRAKVLEYGVFTLPKPISPQILRQALQWMASTRERLRVMERSAATVEEKMEEIRLVNRAKWLLIECLSMSEAEAHRYIEKQAMDRCVSRREIARGIIQTYA